MLTLNIDIQVKMCEDLQGEENSATAHRCVFVITNLIISFNININSMSLVHHISHDGGGL